jgi:mannose-6-phosphate isomerase-like protein (cupin superfamily)
MRATVLETGQGGRHPVGAGSHVMIKGDRRGDRGVVLPLRDDDRAGFPGPPPHRHRALHDMFSVLDGTLTVRLGDETHELGPGACVCAPPGVVHTFSDPSDRPAR